MSGLVRTTYRIKAGFELRAAVLADFHNGDCSAILDMVRKDRPDVILIPGDLVQGYWPKGADSVLERSSNILPFLRGCVEIAPTYFSLGNHECTLSLEEISELKSTGIIFLDDEWTELKILGDKTLARPVFIGGLTSGHVHSYRDFRRAYEQGGGTDKYPSRRKPRDPAQLKSESGWLDEYEKADGYRILMCHHPEYWCLREPMLIDRKFDLVLAGHAHGGQWRIAGRGVLAPGQGLFPKYTEGRFRGSYGEMIVSRGLTNSEPLVPRWGNPCEMIILEFSI